MDWNQILKDYKGFLKLEKGLASNSIDAYLRDIGKFMQFLEISQIEAEPQDLEHQQLHRFLIWISDLGLSARSQARILSGLKAFYRYLLLADLIEKKYL